LVDILSVSMPTLCILGFWHATATAVPWLCEIEPDIPTGQRGNLLSRSFFAWQSASKKFRPNSGPTQSCTDICYPPYFQIRLHATDPLYAYPPVSPPFHRHTVVPYNTSCYAVGCRAVCPFELIPFTLQLWYLKRYLTDPAANA